MAFFGENMTRRRTLQIAAIAVTALMAAPIVQAQTSGPVRVRVQTELGDIVVEVDQARAPATSANFLRYVDARSL